MSNNSTTEQRLLMLLLRDRRQLYHLTAYELDGLELTDEQIMALQDLAARLIERQIKQRLN